VGEVSYEEGKKVSRWITPVPGRIGLMIIAMLLRNTVNDGKWACEEVSRVE
jgi:5,10-methylene-tetrahydrofolate dehydrogenase/methenyl tetrahydrofolate cyclohydrolase